MSTKCSTIFLLSIFLIIALAPTMSFPDQNQADSHLIVQLGEKCVAGPYNQPKGPFTVLVFCEDALGDYIALYYRDIMGAPMSSEFPKWFLGNRVWQDPSWSSDVTGFAWSPSGKFLYVATSEIYGEGALFEIDLASRNSKIIFPKKRPSKQLGYEIEILELNPKKSVLKIRESIYTENPDPETKIHQIKIR